MLPALAALPQAVRDGLEHSVKPKFNAYFAFTGALSRSHPAPGGEAWFVYPDDSLMSDLLVLAALFGETYQAFAEHGNLSELVSVIQADASLRGDFGRLVEGSSPTDPDGSFWAFPPAGSGLVSQSQVVATHLGPLLKTLRNGFLHFHWRYENLSALEYWQVQHWTTNNAPVAFDIQNRPKKNYMAYIADANDWDPAKFWTLRNLRILVTPYGILRYHLHLSLNYLLNGLRRDIFGIPR